MSEPFLGEIRLMSFNFAPKGWVQCAGQLLPINQNQALFALLGTTYGGNGQTTFALPDLRGRVPLHMSPDFSMGQAGGSEAHTISQAEMPQHTHTLSAVSAAATASSPGNAMLATATEPLYKTLQQPIALAPEAVTATGGSQPHTNMQPWLALNFYMAVQGIFPSRN